MYGTVWYGMFDCQTQRPHEMEDDMQGNLNVSYKDVRCFDGNRMR